MDIQRRLGLMLSIGMVLPRIDQIGMIYVNLFHLEEFLEVPLWSLALSCVAVGGLLVVPEN